MKLSESLKLWTSYTPTLWLLRPSHGAEEVKTQRLLAVYLKETYRIIYIHWINRRDRRETHRQNGCDGNSCIHENWKQERKRQEDVRVTLRTSTSENKHCKEEMIIFFDCYKIHSRSSTSTHRYDASCSRFILNTSVSETATWIKTVQEETMLARSPYIYWFQIGLSL